MLTSHILEERFYLMQIRVLSLSNWSFWSFNVLVIEKGKAYTLLILFHIKVFVRPYDFTSGFISGYVCTDSNEWGIAVSDSWIW